MSKSEEPENFDSATPTRHWHRLDDGRVQCDVCPRFCKLHEGQRGLCFVRAREGDAGAHRGRLPARGRVPDLPQIAARLQNWGPIAWFNGSAFMQLGRDWHSFAHELAVPPCPFGIIAGHLPLVTRFHPFLSGATDLLVRVDETHLAGEADFLEVNVPHNWLMNSRRVQAATLSFLKSGRFSPSGVPSPVQPLARRE